MIAGLVILGAVAIVGTVGIVAIVFGRDFFSTVTSDEVTVKTGGHDQNTKAD